MNNIIERKVNIDKDFDLKNYLDSIHLPKKVSSELINKGLVKVEKDKVLFDLAEYDKNDIEPVDIPIDIVYEDSDIVVIKKGRGILIHSDGNTNDTLLNALSFYLLNKGYKLKPRSVHRIDYDTIGLVLFSKNIISYYHLFYQMEQEMIKKKYYLVVGGLLNSGVIEKPIGKNRHKNNCYIVTKSGKRAKTVYEKLDYKDNKTLLVATITTGRTHQIRVHMAYLNHPIIGDKIYGIGEKLMLESFYLGFLSPTNNKYLEIKIDNELEF